MKKVSIVSPVYNGDTYIGYYLDSILSQTYPNLEVIIVNDGSTDSTAHILEEYKSKFKDKGISFSVVLQENGGQASALNNGLKHFTGEYLIWSDSDDIFESESIEKRVEFLEKNKEYGIVWNKAIVVNENNLDEPVGVFEEKCNPPREDLFDDFIFENSVYFCPIIWMVRTEAFLDVNPNREIYVNRAGQNWQMLLPVLLKYKCGYINEPLSRYVIRGNSHSHMKNNMEQLFKKWENHQDILLNTIKKLNVDYSKYEELIKEKYYKKKQDYLAEKYAK